MARKIEIEIVGDTKNFQKSLGDASQSTSKFGSTLAKVGKAAAIGLGAGIAASTVIMKQSIDAAIEAEKAQTRLDSAFSATNTTAKERAAAMDAVSKTSARAALDDEDLMDTLGRLTRVTGDAATAQRDMGIAADIARGRGIELEAATKLVEAAETGRLGALKRMGIEIPKVTEAQDALKAANEKATESQIKAAKAADDTATRQSAIAALQKQYAGAAEAYGNSAAGAQDRFKVAVENLQESLGKKLLPAVAAVAEGASKFITRISEADGASAKFKVATDALKGVAERAASGIMSALGDIDWGKVGQMMGQGISNAADRLTTAIKNADFEKAGGEAVTGFVKGFREFVSNVDWVALAGSIGKLLLAALLIQPKLMLGAGKVIGRAAIDGIRTGAAAAWDSVSAWFSALPDRVRAAAGDLSMSLWSAGRDLILGFISGVKGAAQDLANAALDVARGAVSAVKGFLRIGSPSKVFAEIGADTLRGWILGISQQQPALNEKNKEAVSQALETAKTTVARYQDVFRDAFGKLGDFAKRAFDAKTENLLDNVSKKFDAQIAKWQKFADALTPAEKALAELDAEEAKRSRDSAARAAQDALVAAEAMEEGVEKERAIAAAREQIRQADLANQRAGLQAQAETERAAREERAAAQIAALEATKARELQNLEERRSQLATKLDEQLLTLQERLAKHPEEYNKIQKQINALLASYGIPMQKSGELLGNAFAKGLRDSKAEVVKAATALAKAVQDILKLRSPAKKGPLSDLDTWWRPMGPMLAKQMGGMGGMAVAGAASGMAAAAVGGYGGGGGGRSYVININAPQVNPRETARQIRDELRALDRVETGGSRPALT